MRIIARVVLYWLAFVGLYRAGGFLSTFFHLNDPFRGLGNCLAGIFAAFFTTWAFLKWVKRGFVSIGLFWTKATGGRCIKGFLLGIGISFLMLVIILSYAGGVIQFISWKPDFGTLIAFLMIVAPGIMEEVAFRSYALLQLKRVLGIRASLFLVAFAFAVYHVVMGWSVYLAFIGPFVWSILFGIAALHSGGIAVSCGIHIGVNVFQNVFGLIVGKLTICTLSCPEGSHRHLEIASLGVQVGLFIASLIAVELFISSASRFSVPENTS